ncbi:MAG: hypothetical protein ACI4D9_05345 [Lachnospiraceae bacterium]
MKIELLIKQKQYSNIMKTICWYITGVNNEMKKGESKMAKSKLVKANEKIAEEVVGGYKKIEEGVVGGYKKIEEGAVSGFNKVADKFVDSF